MIYFYSIFLLILNNFSLSAYSHILKTDCYESLLNSTKRIKVSHYYNNGPPYLFISFRYKLSSFIFGFVIKQIYENFDFKKIDQPCETSIIFTTIGKDFNILNIYVEVSLFNNFDVISIFEYNFTKGFEPGIYQFQDLNKNFELNLKVIDDKKEILSDVKRSLERKNYYLKLISKENKNEMCIVTEYNKYMIIKPEYILERPNGLLTNFGVVFLINRKAMYTITYPAFACNNNSTYPHLNEKVAFIFSESKLDFYFKAKYLIFSEKSYKIKSYQFTLNNIIYEYVNNLKKLSKQYKKLFLMRPRIENIKCPDNTKRLISRSSHGTPYMATELKEINISSTIKRAQLIYHFPLDPCRAI